MSHGRFHVSFITREFSVRDYCFQLVYYGHVNLLSGFFTTFFYVFAFAFITEHLQVITL